MKLLIYFLILFAFVSPSYGAFYISYQLNYQSETDSGDASALSSTRTMHNLFIGASLDKNNQLYLGQNILSWNKSVQQGEDSDQQVTLNLLELGPRLHYYFSPERNWFISATYNFQSKGTGLLNGETATITGTGSIGSLGYHYKVTKALGIGASISYHSVVITSRKVDDTDSEVTETYNSIVPMLEFAWRFR